MHALRRELLRASGVEYAISLRLLPSTVFRSRSSDGESPKSVCNLVVARSNSLRIYEVQEEELPPVQAQSHTQSRSKPGTEAVEGEAEIEGDGFVNIGMVKSTPAITQGSMTTLRFYLIREHRLHGIVTGLESVKLGSSLQDNLDRLLISFKDTKIALLEWSTATHDLTPVSIHTYERVPQMANFDPRHFKSELRVDSNSRCAALLLPKDTLAILPFHQAHTDLDLMEVDQAVGGEIPYAPSFVVDLASDVDSRVRNVIDYVFLPGFINPTIAVLFQPQQTWTGRLKEYKDTVQLYIFTLDLISRKFPIITTIDNLPHDSFSLHPCDARMGGSIILTANSIIYVDQASRKTALPVNGWAQRVSDMPMQPLRPEELERNLRLEGAKVGFMDEKTLFVVTKDGNIYPVEIIMEGRIVSRLSMGAALAETTIPSVVTVVRVDSRRFLFVGSSVGPSVLLKTMRVEEDIPQNTKPVDAPTVVVDTTPAIDIDIDDDDDDIYGDIKSSSLAVGQLSVGNTHAVERRSVIHLSLCDSLPAYGPITDITFTLTRNGERPVAELIASTGHGRLGGFTLFQKDLPTRTKRKVHVVGGARGVWSLPIRQTSRSAASSTRAHASQRSDIDTVIVSTDANPSPGLTRFASRTSRRDAISITTRRTETTIGAAPFFQRTAILHVTTDAIRVLEPDCTERQCIKDMDGAVKRPKIRYCCISDPFILILREDDSLGLFVGNAETGRIRRKDMTAMGEKVSRYSAGCFFSDQTGVVDVLSNPASPTTERGEGSKSKNTAGSLEATLDSNQGTQWLMLCRPQGVVEIWTLPKLTIVFSNSVIRDLPMTLSDSFDPPAVSLPEDPPRKPQDLDIDQIQVSPLGDSRPQLHLMVLLRCGQFAVYQAVADETVEWRAATSRTSAACLKFVKLASRSFEPRQEVTEKSTLSEQRRILRVLIPFVTSPRIDHAVSGVFFTGDQPCWIFSTAKDGVRIHPCGYAVVHSFTTCSMWDSRGDFLLYTDEGPCLLEWLPDVNVGTDMPSRSVGTAKTYTSVTFDTTTGLVVAASSLQSRFGLYDDDGNSAWEPDAPSINYPLTDTSSLELFAPDFAYVLDGYEFAPNEFVNALECIPLETQSTESGVRDYIVVGTTIDRGEDLAVKGATYVFEIVEVVPDPERVPDRNYKLRLRCRDDAKGPVTALSGMNRYLVSSMGQKIFVRAFDLDERLVGVAFLDVGLYVTTLRTIKNLLLVGDVVKSVWFVAFQEEPFKLVIIAKDVRACCVTSADFLFTSEGQFYITMGDEEGIVRLLEYEPTDPESRNGQYLLCRSEFHGQVDCRSTALIARRPRDEEGLIPQARLISAASDGSMYSLTPVDEVTQKRMELLQGQLVRKIQHVAGLNPKAFRVVRNDFEPKPLSTGILDGNLLVQFTDLSIPQQEEVTAQIGTDRATVLSDWNSMSGPW